MNAQTSEQSMTLVERLRNPAWDEVPGEEPRLNIEQTRATMEDAADLISAITALRSRVSDTVTDPERARIFMEDILRQPDCCDAELVILAERFDKAMALLRNINDLFYDYPLPANETLAEEVREFFGLPV